MEPLQFGEIRELLNACRLTTIGDVPAETEKGCWELYKGNYRAHVLNVPFEVLYFLSDAPTESIKNAKRKVFRPKETFVVYAPSSKNREALRAEFEGVARGFWNTREYLASFMSNELDAYRKALLALAPLHYVEPAVEVPAGTTHRIPNPLRLFLTDPPTSTDQEGGGSVAVVLAEAGHGKTYMCNWLAAKLATSQFGVLPIFVSSSQWQRLRPEELASLGTTVVSSFRDLGTPIPWVEGQEDLFLRVALKAGLFRIVFDGFDEYVLKMPGDVGVDETLAAIGTLASDTGARVILTSRTSFWKSEVQEGNNCVSGLPFPATVSVFSLSPFSEELARNYFNLRFPTDAKKVDRAVQIFRELSKDDPEFAGRGFVLVLVADLVDSGQDLGTTSEKPLIRLMRAHCDRERLRHSLQLTAKQQLDALKEFVFEVTQGETPDSDLLSLAIHSVASDLTTEDVTRCVEKMVPHALIDGSGDTWRVRQTQVEIALLAMKLIGVASGDTNLAPILNRFSNCALQPELEADLAEMLIALSMWGRTRDDGVSAIKKLIEAFFAASALPAEHLRKSSLRRLSTSMALRAIEQSTRLSHVERAEEFPKMFPEGRYRGIVLFGALARFDWSGTKFENCVFDNVRWSNCRFDSRTTFNNCHLLGGTIQYCAGFADAAWKGCVTDVAGRQFLEDIEVSAGKKAYTEEHLRRDVYAVLEKFAGKGGVGFRSIKNRDFGRGKLATSPHKDVIIDTTRKRLLEEHHISGVDGGGLSIQQQCKEAVRVLFANNAWTGELVRVLDELRKRTGITK